MTEREARSQSETRRFSGKGQAREYAHELAASTGRTASVYLDSQGFIVTTGEVTRTDVTKVLTANPNCDRAEIAFRTVLAYNTYRADDTEDEFSASIADLIDDLKVLAARDYGIEV